MPRQDAEVFFRDADMDIMLDSTILRTHACAAGAKKADQNLATHASLLAPYWHLRLGERNSMAKP